MFNQKLLILEIFVILIMSPIAFGQTDICIPQFVDGIVGPLQYRTMVVLQNQEQNQAQVQLQFYDNNGAPMQQFMMHRRGMHGGQSPASNGQFTPDPIGPGGAMGYRSGGEGGFQVGFVQIQSQSRIQAHTRAQLFDLSGNLLSETNIIPGPQFHNGSFYADRADGAGIGLALTNISGNQTTICTLEIFADDGTLLDTTQITLGPHSQIAQFLFQIFPDILTDDVGYVRISCDNPICALALHLRGFGMTQIPVVVEDIN